MLRRTENKRWFGLTVVILWYLAFAGLARAHWPEQAKLTASDRTPGDMFGVCVSTSGEYAIAGAWWDDDNGTNSGSAYIFKKPAGSWVDMVETAKLTASDAAAADIFGRSVSVSGDWAIVGAYADDDNGTDSGSAYVFKKPTGGWVDMTQTTKLTTLDGAAHDNFGVSASMSGNYAVIGANFEDGGGVENSGSAYVFKWDGTSWIEQDKLVASDGEIGDEFGYAVSISGDYAIVGVYKDDDNGADSGSAYIFKRDGETWAEQQKLIPSDGQAYDRFGFCVSISGDYAIIGAYKDDDYGESSGSAYIFKRDGETWVEEQPKLRASNGVAGDRFGYSVSISGDCAAVGAFADDDNGTDSGSAYIFKRDGTSWIEQEWLLASDGNYGDYLGVSISISGDHVIVGAQEDDSSTGSAYVFAFRQPTEEILDFIDDSVDANTLEPVKEGKPGQGQLGALINMIEAAGNLIDAELLADACWQLQDALEKTDGLAPPESAPDFVTGVSAPELAGMIEVLMESLGCE